MTPEETARASARSVVELPGRFMVDGATYRRGAELGFSALDFYFAGRAGVLGDVPGEVAAAALVFFEPSTVSLAWERARKVSAPADAAREFAACAHEWARAHLPEGPDYARLAELLGAVLARADAAGAPLFAGWRRLEEPADSPALALHRLNALRELRGALHAVAVLAEGLEPLEALLVHRPEMAGIFGWQPPYPDVAGRRDAWRRAEGQTNALLGRRLAMLTGREREELVELLRAANGETAAAAREDEGAAR
jgi:hypothetical protein